MEEYCWALEESQESLTTANIFCGPNNYLPLLIMDKKPRFAHLRSNYYKEEYISDVCHQFELIRNTLNSKKYSIKYLWDRISHRDKRPPYSVFRLAFLSVLCSHYTLKYYFDMSACINFIL